MNARLVTRSPTREEIAIAWIYIERNWVLTEGQRIEGYQWAEALAWSDVRHQGRPERRDYAQADNALSQLTETQWRDNAATADIERSSQGDPPRFKVRR